LAPTHVRLHRSFLRAVRESRLTMVQLTALCDYAAPAQLSNHLNSQFTLTPLTLRRLRLLAEVVGYEGELVARRG
jgi:transcriptional regulator GlxA family with amidase domain